MKQILIFGLILVLAACGQGDDEAEEQVAESESAEEETPADAESTEEPDSNDTEENTEATKPDDETSDVPEGNEEDTASTEEDDETPEENTESDEPLEITVESVLAEEEGTDPDGDSLEEEMIEYVEETGIDNLTSESMYNRAIEVVGGDPEMIEAIEFFKTYDPELNVDLTDMPGGLEVDGDTVLLNNNIYILLDNSSSMLEEVDGRTKMEIAREAIDDFASEFPDGVQVSLINYGFGDEDGTDAGSCEAIETTYPLDDYKSDSFNEALNEYEPVGFTPIAAAIEEVGEQVSGSDAAGSHTIYIVSDGRETCDGDPVEAVENLPQDDNVETVLNIIGFDINDEEVQDLVDITVASGGEYFEANDTVELENTLRREKNRLINEWTEWSNENLFAITREYNDTASDRREMYNQGSGSITRTSNELRFTDTRLQNDYRGEDLPSFSDYAIERRDVVNEFFEEHNEEGREITDESYEERRAEVEALIEENREEFVEEEVED